MGGGTLTGEDGLEGTSNTVRNGEFNLGINELLNVRTTNLRSFDLSNTDDLNGTETGTVTGSHVHVEALDGFNTAHGTELLVHVVGAGTRIVTQPNTEILNLHGLLLANGSAADNFSSGTLNLLELTQEVEETRFGNDFVGSEDAHLVELRSGILFGGEFTTDNLIFNEHLNGDGWIRYKWMTRPRLYLSNDLGVVLTPGRKYYN